MRVLNFARGELVDNAALLNALDSGKVAHYFCDFPTEELLGVKGVECTPHLGASTPESETNCAVMAAAELSDYLKNGNITHSVNLPDVSQPRMGGRRICIIHKNTPGAISAITGVLTAAHLNIENMVNKSKKGRSLHAAGCDRRPHRLAGRRTQRPGTRHPLCASCDLPRTAKLPAYAGSFFSPVHLLHGLVQIDQRPLCAFGQLVDGLAHLAAVLGSQPHHRRADGQAHSRCRIVETFIVHASFVSWVQDQCAPPPPNYTENFPKTTGKSFLSPRYAFFCPFVCGRIVTN